MSRVNPSAKVTLKNLIDAGIYYLGGTLTFAEITQPNQTYFYGISGVETLTGNISIQPSADVTYKEGDSFQILWNCTATLGSYTVYVGAVNFTGVLAGAVLAQINLFYSNSKWNIVCDLIDINNAFEGYTAPVTSVNEATGDVVITKGTIGLSAVENTALSSWTGSSNIATVGTITAGTWSGTSIVDGKIASSATWNAKANTAGPTFTGTSTFDIVKAKKLTGASAIGATTLGVGAGTGATVTVSGSDIGFQVNITTGTGCTINASVVSIAFGSSYSASPLAFIQPRNANATSAVFALVTPQEAVGNVQFNSGGTALADNTQYIFNVMIIGQQ